MDAKSPHRGITMHAMPVGGNFPGMVFAIGSALIFLFAIPALWFVMVAALAAGCVMAALIQIAHRKPTEVTKLTLRI